MVTCSLLRLSGGLCDLEVFPNLPEAVCPGVAPDESTYTYLLNWLSMDMQKAVYQCDSLALCLQWDV